MSTAKLINLITNDTIAIDVTSYSPYEEYFRAESSWGWLLKTDVPYRLVYEHILNKIDLFCVFKGHHTNLRGRAIMFKKINNLEVIQLIGKLI